MGRELGSPLRPRVRTCLSPAGALGIGIPLPNVLGIPLIKVDIQILAVSVWKGYFLLQGAGAGRWGCF